MDQRSDKVQDTKHRVRNYKIRCMVLFFAATKYRTQLNLTWIIIENMHYKNQRI